MIGYSRLDFSALTNYSEFDCIKHPGMQSLSSVGSLDIPDPHGPFSVISGLFGNSKWSHISRGLPRDSPVCLLHFNILFQYYTLDLRKQLTVGEYMQYNNSNLSTMKASYGRNEHFMVFLPLFCGIAYFYTLWQNVQCILKLISKKG